MLPNLGSWKFVSFSFFFFLSFTVLALTFRSFYPFWVNFIMWGRCLPLACGYTVFPAPFVHHGDKVETVSNFIFLGFKINVCSDLSYEIKRLLCLGRKAMTNLDSILKSRGTTLLRKVCLVKAMVLPGGMYGCENWTVTKAKHWRRCFWTVLVKTLETPLDNKEVKPVNPKGNQPWIFIERTDAEAPKLQPPDVKSQLTGNDSDTGKDWRWEEKGMTEDEMVGWHHQFKHKLEQTLGDSEGQGSLVCCSPWGHKELDTT